MNRLQTGNIDPMKVSVIIPCYNQAHFLGQAIESALNQLDTNVEVIVVNDGSRDQTAQIAGKYPDVIYIEQSNSGLSAARNRGFEASSAEYIIFLDSDDFLGVNAAMSGLASLQETPEAAFTFGAMQTISVDGSPISQRLPLQTCHYYRELLANNYIPTPGMVMFRRSSLEEFGLFDISLPACEDYDLYLRMTWKGTATSHPEIVVFKRTHPEAMTGNARLMLRMTLRVLNSQKKHMRSNRKLEEYFNKGIQFWRSWYGNQVLTSLRVNLHQKKYGEALQNILSLFRYYPGALIRLLIEAGKSNSVYLMVSTVEEGIFPGWELNLHKNQNDASENTKKIVSLSPNQIDIGQSIPAFWNGRALISISCTQANKCALLFMNGRPIETVWKNSHSMVGYIPQESLTEPKIHEIYFIS